VASFVSVRSSQSFHAVQADESGLVSSVGVMPDQALWINGGFFILRKEIFSHIEEGDELVEKPLARLIAQRKAVTFRWDGFWQCMDTFKDKIGFDRMEAQGKCPWMVWSAHPANAADRTKD
jgi:glucose-1-phosphate cytidylyltransferase